MLPGITTENLGASGYRIKREHESGPIGSRWLVESQIDGSQRLADLVFPDDDSYTSALCQNALRTRAWTEDRCVVNVLEAGWLPDGQYFQILDMAPHTVSLPEAGVRLDEQQLWKVAASLVSALRHLHRRELVHAGVSPRCVYKEGDQARLGELWFAHNADGQPLHPDLAEYFPAGLPDFLWPYAAPELLLGQPPGREGDIFSLGAVLFFLSAGQPPRPHRPGLLDEGARRLLAQTGAGSLKALRPDLSDDLTGLIAAMLALDPSRRPKIFVLEAICREESGQQAEEDEDRYIP
ncbi:MAG TPA: hypothetical protein V6D08_21035 [Candidatus Obscuribacterales bacterium]